MNAITSAHYLRTVVRERSISKAAQRLGISQPALSKYIKNIEEMIGITIFNRSKLPIELTPEGEEFMIFIEETRLNFQAFKERIAKNEKL